MQRRRHAFLHPLRRLRLLIPDQRLAFVIAQKQAILRGAGRVNHQPWRVGVAHEVVVIDPLVRKQLMHDGEREQAVSAGPDRHPFVGDGAVAGAYRIDAHKLGAARLQLVEANLDRV